MSIEIPEVPEETLEQKLHRYECTLQAIRDCILTGVDYGDWVQACTSDALEGLFPECYNCGTFVHEGPCADESDHVDSKGAKV